MNFYRINFRDILFQYCGWSRFIQYQFDSISISWTMSYLSKRRDNLLKGVSSDRIQAWWVIDWKVLHHFRFSIPPFNPRNGKIIPFNPHNSNAFRIPLHRLFITRICTRVLLHVFPRGNRALKWVERTISTRISGRPIWPFRVTWRTMKYYSHWFCLFPSYTESIFNNNMI